MSYVATLIGPLNDFLLAEAEHLSGALRTEWLQPNYAADIFTGSAPDLAGWAEVHQCDVIVQPLAGRRKRVLLADMESTIIEQEMLDEMAVHVGKSNEVSEITRRSMNGELDFRAALVERLAMLKGISARAIDDLATRMTLIPGAKELVGTLSKYHVHCVLVSGGFTCFTEIVAKKVGFHKNFGNTLGMAGGKISGEIVEPVLDKNSKLDILNATAAALNIAPEDICAVGDGANDVPMLQAAGLGVAYYGKPAVRAQVKNNIRFTDLRSLLFAQGYPASMHIKA